MNPNEKALNLVGEIEDLMNALQYALNDTKEADGLLNWADVAELEYTKEKLGEIVDFYLGEAE